MQWGQLCKRLGGKRILTGGNRVWELSVERRGCREGQGGWSVLVGTVAGGKVHFLPDPPNTTYPSTVAVACLWQCLLCWPGWLGL